MKDGKQTQVPMGGGGDNVEDFTISFDLQVVIDPQQIASFSFGDMTIQMS